VIGEGPSRVIYLTNSLEETVKALSQVGKGTTDLLWVGVAEGWCTWDVFSPITRGVTYDSDYGAQEISGDLITIGAD
jgi:hypothetical protein